MNTDTPHIPEEETHTQASGPGFVREIVKIILISVAIVLPIRIFIAQPYIVSGSSMDPTFETRDYIIVDQLSYRFHDPERLDVIILRYPNDPSQFFIKRVIGLPGETVSITQGEVSIITSTSDETITLSEPYIVHEKADTSTTVLGENEFFVMGDNRLASLDSRIWGPLDRDFIVGRALLRLLPVQHMGLYPGNPEDFTE
jgi:signal peptidase I